MLYSAISICRAGRTSSTCVPMETWSGMLGTFISPLLWVRDHWVRGGRGDEGAKGKAGPGFHREG